MRAHVVNDGIIVDVIETPTLSIFGMYLIDAELGGDIGDEVVDGVPIKAPQPQESEE